LALKTVSCCVALQFTQVRESDIAAFVETNTGTKENREVRFNGWGTNREKQGRKQSLLIGQRGRKERRVSDVGSKVNRYGRTNALKRSRSAQRLVRLQGSALNGTRRVMRTKKGRRTRKRRDQSDGEELKGIRNR
jgi:hypothetical protein